jgi:hypothetical protein
VCLWYKKEKKMEQERELSKQKKTSNGIKGPFNISKYHLEIFGKFLIKGFDLFYVISKLLTFF